MRAIAIVMLGGGMGAAMRYATGLAASRWLGPAFPWGTLAVNLLGCFLIGFIFGLSEKAAVFSHEARLFFVTGFLGALTTFSSFALESAMSARTGMTTHAVLNIAVNNIAGIALVFAGIGAAGYILSIAR